MTVRQFNDRIRLYMGTTGSGKTYLFCQHLAEENRVILFDTVGDDKFNRWGVLVDKVGDVAVLMNRETTTGNFHIRVQWDDPEKFDFVCKMAMMMGNVTIAVDELSLFTNAHYIPPNFSKVVRLGRHAGPDKAQQVRLMATTQRPPDIQALILSQTKELYLFQMHSPNDLQYLGKFVPDIERVQNLQIGEYILWNPSAKNRQASAPSVQREDNLPPTDLPSSAPSLPESSPRSAETPAETPEN